MSPTFRVVWFLILSLSSTAAYTQTRAQQSPIPTQLPGQNAILMGVAWYPEQWPESRWEEDLP